MKGFSLLQQEELRFERGGIGWNPQASGVPPGVLGNGGSRCHQGSAAYIEPAPQVASPEEGCPPGLSICTGPSPRSYLQRQPLLLTFTGPLRTQVPQTPRKAEGLAARTTPKKHSTH